MHTRESGYKIELLLGDATLTSHSAQGSSTLLTRRVYQEAEEAILVI